MRWHSSVLCTLVDNYNVYDTQQGCRRKRQLRTVAQVPVLLNSVTPLAICPAGSTLHTSTTSCRALQGNEPISILNSPQRPYHVYLVLFLVPRAPHIRLLLALRNPASVSFVHPQEITRTFLKARAARSSPNRFTDRFWCRASEGS